jgi:lipoate-protein ligase A
MTTRAGLVVDTGLRSGPENIRLDREQWRAAQEAETPVCHVRFHRYRPSAVFGAFETAGHALHAEYCRSHGIDIVRRVSGGGAVYLDADQLCWTLTLAHPIAWGEMRLTQWMARLGDSVAGGLRRAGVHASFVPPNDIEAEGRKLASCFLALSDSALLFQGSILLGFDTETMMKALRVPTEKLSLDGIRSARHRFATLGDGSAGPEISTIEQHLLDNWAEQLGVEFGPKVNLAQAPVTDADNHVVPAENWDAETDSWHLAWVKTPGGLLYARLRLNSDGDVLQQVEFAGGVQAYPAYLFTSLASWLAKTRVAWLEDRFNDFFRTYPHDLLGFTAENIRHVLNLALERHAQQVQFALTSEQANTLMVHAPPPQEAADIVRVASVMLVPYCAKPSWCEWRHSDECPDCGLCEVGEAYRLARERGMRVVTITHFEHLQTTLGELRAAGVRSYVGMCCRTFFIKREFAFREAGIPAVLMDITGTNCCELQQEDPAYAGKFQAEAYLNLDVLRKVMQRVPPVMERMG